MIAMSTDQLTAINRMLITSTSNQAWAFRTSDVGINDFCPRTCHLDPKTGPSDLPDHDSAKTDHTAKYDLSIRIYILWGIHFSHNFFLNQKTFYYKYYHWNKIWFLVFHISICLIKEFLSVRKSGTYWLPRGTWPHYLRQVPGLTTYWKICSGL